MRRRTAFGSAGRARGARTERSAFDMVAGRAVNRMCPHLSPHDVAEIDAEVRAEQ